MLRSTLEREGSPHEKFKRKKIIKKTLLHWWKEHFFPDGINSDSDVEALVTATCIQSENEMVLQSGYGIKYYQK